MIRISQPSSTREERIVEPATSHVVHQQALSIHANPVLVAAKITPVEAGVNGGHAKAKK